MGDECCTILLHSESASLLSILCTLSVVTTTSSAKATIDQGRNLPVVVPMNTQIGNFAFCMGIRMSLQNAPNRRFHNKAWVPKTSPSDDVKYFRGAQLPELGTFRGAMTGGRGEERTHQGRQRGLATPSSDTFSRDASLTPPECPGSLGQSKRSIRAPFFWSGHAPNFVWLARQLVYVVFWLLQSRDDYDSSFQIQHLNNHGRP